MPSAAVVFPLPSPVKTSIRGAWLIAHRPPVVVCSRYACACLPGWNPASPIKIVFHSRSPGMGANKKAFNSPGRREIEGLSAHDFTSSFTAKEGKTAQAVSRNDQKRNVFWLPASVLLPRLPPRHARGGFMRFRNRLQRRDRV